MIKVFTIIAIITGIFLRFYDLNTVPEGLFSDEVSIAVNAKTIAENGVDEYGNKYPFVFESFSDYKLPGYIYTSSLFYSVFGNEVFTPRLPSALSSVISIFLLGYLARLLFPKMKNFSLFSMSVIALSPYHIHFSRMAYETMLATTMLLVFSISLFKIIYQNNRNPIWFLTLSLSIVLSIWTYPAPKLIIPAMLIATFLHKTLKNRTQYKIYAKQAVLLFVPVLIAFIPSILDRNIDDRPLGYIVSSSNTSLAASIISKIEATFISFVSMFNVEYLFKKGDNFALRHGTREAGVFLSFFLPSFAIGILLMVRNLFRSTSYTHLFLMLIIFSLPSSLTALFPYGPRFLPALIPLTLIIALGAVTLVTRLKKSKKLYTIITLTAFALLLFQTLSFAHIYFVHFKRVSKTEMAPTPQKVADIINTKRSQHSEKKIYLFGGKTCREWGHDILHIWYFADLDNKKMIEWNNDFRAIRYQNEAPFSGYDTLTQPRYSINNLVIHPQDEEAVAAEKGSIIIRCALHKENINWENEKEIDTIYLYQQQKQDAHYVVTEKL